MKKRKRMMRWLAGVLAIGMLGSSIAVSAEPIAAAEAETEVVAETELIAAAETETEAETMAVVESESETEAETVAVAEAETEAESNDEETETELVTLIQAGGLEDAYYPSEDSAGIDLMTNHEVDEASTIGQMQAEITKALERKDKVVDLSSYNIEKTEAGKAMMRSAFQHAVNENYQIFFLTTKVTYYIKDTGEGKIYSKLGVTYADEYLQEDGSVNAVLIDTQLGQIEEKLSEILEMVVDDEMSDLEKTLAVYNYVMANASYNMETTKPPYAYTIYGALVKGDCVCQGYGIALCALLSRMGIDNYFVTSNAMNHGWNLVYIDGYWYHMDATWDDKRSSMTNTGDILVQGIDPGYFSHANFLLSDSVFGATHYGWSDALPKATDSQGLQGYVFKNTDGQMGYADGYWYYIKDGLCRSRIDGSDPCMMAKAKDVYYVFGQNNSIYFSTLEGIYEYRPADDLMRRLYTVDDDMAERIIQFAGLWDGAKGTILQDDGSTQSYISFDLTHVSETPLQLPEFTCELVDGQVMMHWTSVPYAERYTVYKLIEGQGWESIYTIGSFEEKVPVADEMSFEDTGALGRSYYVAAEAEGVPSGVSERENYYIYQAPEIAAQAQMKGIMLTLSAEADVQAFKLERFDVDLQKTEEIQISDRTYLDTDLINGHKYLYRACCLYTDGEQGSEFNADEMSAMLYMEIPEVHAYSAGKNKVRIEWEKVKDVDGYLIYAHRNGVYGYVSMVSSASNLNTYVDTKASDQGMNRYYVLPFVRDTKGQMIVRSYLDTSSGNNQAKGVCPAVTNLRAGSVAGGARVVWDASPDAEGYLIYGIRPGGSYGYISMTTKGVVYTDTKAVKDAWTFYWVYPYHRDASGKMIVGGTPKYTYGRAK